MKKSVIYRVSLEFHKIHDSDIIAALENAASVESKQGYIKRLIRADIARIIKIVDNNIDY